MTELQIRPAGLLDLLSLSTPPALTLRLNLAQRLLFPHHPVGELLVAWLRPQEMPCTLLCYGEAGLLASAQARPRWGLNSWEVHYLAAWKAAGDIVPLLWEELLAKLGAEAGQHGAIRLFASLPTEHHLEPFSRAAFVPYAEESVLRLDDASSHVTESLLDLRLAQPADLWAIQQLYLGLTPIRVQKIEERGSDSWQPQRDQEAWIWREQDRCLAYLRRHRGPRGTILEVLLDALHREAAPAILAQGLTGANPPFYLILRSYQSELLEMAYRLGFRPYAEQVLLSKQLAVPAEQRQVVPGRKSERQLGTAPSAPSVGRLCRRL